MYTGNSTSWGEWRGRRGRCSKSSSATESSRLTWARDAALLVCQAVDENLVNTAVHTHLTSLHSPFLPPFAHRPSLWQFSFCAKEQCKRGLEKGNICIWGGAGQPATTGVISFVLEWWTVAPFIIQFVCISEVGEQCPFPSEPQAHCIDQYLLNKWATEHRIIRLPEWRLLGLKIWRKKDEFSRTVIFLSSKLYWLLLTEIENDRCSLFLIYI